MKKIIFFKNFLKIYLKKFSRICYPIDYTGDLTMKQIFSSSLIASLIFSMSSLSAATVTDTETGSITITVTPFVDLILSNSAISITTTSTGTTTSGSSGTPLGINTISNDQLTLTFELDNLSAGGWGSDEMLGMTLYDNNGNTIASATLFTAGGTATGSFPNLSYGNINYSAGFHFTSTNTSFNGNLTADLVVTATAEY